MDLEIHINSEDATTVMMQYCSNILRKLRHCSECRQSLLCAMLKSLTAMLFGISAKPKNQMSFDEL